MCFKRVACLKIVELESEAFDDFDIIHKRIKEKLYKQNIHLNLKTGNNQDQINKDNISHFMLRLAYCRSNDYRRWLTNQETRLFKHILYEQTNKDELRLRNIMTSKNIKYESVTKEEWEQFRDQISWKIPNAIRR